MNNQTIEKLKNMRLGAMARLHQQNVEHNKLEGITCDEYLAILTDHQWEERENNKTERLIKQACFRQTASIADINYRNERNLDKNMFLRLSTLDFISRKENIIICGASGTGKSYIAQALGNQACLYGKKTFYGITSRIFKRLNGYSGDIARKGSISPEYPVARFDPNRWHNPSEIPNFSLIKGNLVKKARFSIWR